MELKHILPNSSLLGMIVEVVLKFGLSIVDVSFPILRQTCSGIRHTKCDRQCPYKSPPMSMSVQNKNNRIINHKNMTYTNLASQKHRYGKMTSLQTMLQQSTFKTSSFSHQSVQSKDLQSYLHT